MKINTVSVPEDQLPMTISELFNYVIDEVYIHESKVIIKFKAPITFLVPGDFEITTNGELSVLSRGNIALDGKEVHLKSYNSKQIREMKEELLQELYKEIGNPPDLKEVETIRQQYMIDFKETLKQEILEELRS
ncbi:MAG: hypothetical protein WC503_06020 [Candidatus Shapirobacteria bacterium]